VIDLPGRSEDPVDPDPAAKVGFWLPERGEKDRDAVEDPEAEAALGGLLREEYERSRARRRQIERVLVPLGDEERARLEALGYGASDR
jgi:hypothetical protein